MMYMDILCVNRVSSVHFDLCAEILWTTRTKTNSLLYAVYCLPYRALTVQT